MKSPDDLTPQERTCSRCAADVLRVVERPPLALTLDLDTRPIPVDGRGSTGPYFERHGQHFRPRGSVGGPPKPRGWPIHAPHHCPPPAICRHCEQIHHPEHDKENVA